MSRSPNQASHRRRLARILASALALLAGVAAAASPFQSVESIQAAAIGAVEAGDAEASLDSALRMPACTQPLEARRASAGTVEVGCPDAWRLYVPVRVRRSQTVLVLARGVAHGETITADLFIPEQRDTTRIAGAAIADPADAVGRTARRMLSAGSVLTTSDLVAPRLVRRGDTIALVSRQSGVEVRMAGRALGDAGASERVSVENLSSRRVVQGIVGPAGDVIVGR